MSPQPRSIILLLTVALLAASAEASDPPGDPLSALSRLSDGSRLDLPELDPSVPAPGAVLGYPLGSRFSHWPAIRGYFEALDRASERVTTWSYGATYEGRPLLLAAISSAENLARLDEIRNRNQQLAEPTDGSDLPQDAAALDGPAIVWLGYGIHGNEASSAEAAMAVAYLLAAAEDDGSDVLRNVVVLIDPLANPDGRERYVHFFETRRGRSVDPLADAAEHRETWPGGRQNHYLVDLNRDWAWATQLETRGRLDEIRKWEPQVVVDLHEMAAEATYFFPPSALPVHDRIDRRTIDWLERFGRANAAAFDARGWIYYSGENFDLYYPGYGDSYPSLRGAVGMTYEVAGHAAAGLALRLADGAVLTLADRIARHVTSSLTTVRTAAASQRELLADFAANRRRSFNESTRSYLWEANELEARWMAATLEGHGIRVERLSAAAELSVRPIGGGESSPRRFPAGSWVASTAQPLGGLLRSLMDLEWPMPAEFIEQQRLRLDQNRSARFFDITAWSLPLAGNVETWMLDGSTGATAARPVPEAEPTPAGSVGFLAPPAGLAGYRFAAALLAEGVRFRLALKPLTTGGTRYPAGTLFVPARGGNSEKTADSVQQAAIAAGVRLDAVDTSFSEEGISLGSQSMPAIRPGRIGLLSGRGVGVTSFGFLWHLLDQGLEAPHHRLSLDSLGELDLRAFDVLVLPDGDGYSKSLDDAAAQSLTAWVEGGGILVAVGQAIDWLQERELTEVIVWKPPVGDEAEADRETPAAGRSGHFAERSLDTPGAAVNTVLSVGHPIAAGLPRAPAALIQGSAILVASGDPQRDLLTVDLERPIAAGFAWPEARERLAGSLLVGIEKRGEGRVVVFRLDPCFRLFWRATTPLFLNTVLFGPSLQDRDLL